MSKYAGKHVQYSSNNSGGGWWLKDEHWHALEKAGWEVDWYANNPEGWHDKETGRFLGALASYATRRDVGLAQAIEEWEEITGQHAADAGCRCCGQPHNFTLYDADGRYIDYGPEVYYPREDDDY